MLGRRALADVEASFEEAFDDLFRRAQRSAQRILGDAGAAEDVAAEALARAFSRWDRIAELPYRDAWVLRVAINLALDIVRKRKPEIREAPVHDPGDETALRLTLLAALRELPARQREAVTLRYLTDLSEAEVAAALQVSPGTIKTHVHRGIAALRDRLGTDVEELTPDAD